MATLLDRAYNTGTGKTRNFTISAVCNFKLVGMTITGMEIIFRNFLNLKGVISRGTKSKCVLVVCDIHPQAIKMYRAHLTSGREQTVYLGNYSNHRAGLRTVKKTRTVSFPIQKESTCKLI